jgi:hypothetical protein
MDDYPDIHRPCPPQLPGVSTFKIQESRHVGRRTFQHLHSPQLSRVSTSRIQEGFIPTDIQVLTFSLVAPDFSPGLTNSIKYSGLQSNIFNRFIVVLVVTEQDIGLKPEDKWAHSNPGLKSGATECKMY